MNLTMTWGDAGASFIIAVAAGVVTIALWTYSPRIVEWTKDAWFRRSMASAARRINRLATQRDSYEKLLTDPMQYQQAAFRRLAAVSATGTYLLLSFAMLVACLIVILAPAVGVVAFSVFRILGVFSACLMYLGIVRFRLVQSEADRFFHPKSYFAYIDNKLVILAKKNVQSASKLAR